MKRKVQECYSFFTYIFHMGLFGVLLLNFRPKTPLFFILPLVFALPCLSEKKEEIFKKAEKFYQWGEYDSLLITIPPILRDTAFLLDGGETAYLHKYLGLANFMKRDTIKAVSHYKKTLDIVGDASLDSLFVSRAAYMHFMAVKQIWLQENLHQQDKAESVKSTPMAEKPEKSSSRPILQTPLKPVPAKSTSAEKPATLLSKPNFYLLLTGMTASGILGSLAYQQYREGDGLLKEADKACYPVKDSHCHKKLDEVHKSDRITLAYGGGSLLAAAAGVYFLMKTTGGKSAPSGEARQSHAFCIQLNQFAGFTATWSRFF